MSQPVCDFAKAYAASGMLRMHMPGHKGRVLLGPEPLDITEIPGADVLYSAKGILRESERNTERLFGSARTVFSAEGSSLCIRAMLYLAQMHAALNGKRCVIAAGRNAHRVFSDAAALLDPQICWIGSGDDLLHCDIVPEELEQLFKNEKGCPTAVYVTSPDYLGRIADLDSIAAVCRRHGALFLVDNAHGAYMKFLNPSLHPLDHGADLCCDSAHKTLPALTGAAWLHAGQNCPQRLVNMMERAMALFASTSPSYLILQSIDAVNGMLENAAFRERLASCVRESNELKKRLSDDGWKLAGEEPLKLTLCPKSKGYTGEDLGQELRNRGIISEFADPDYLVLMFSSETHSEELRMLEVALRGILPRPAVDSKCPLRKRKNPEYSLRKILLLPFENVPAEQAVGRVLASPGVSCPPAIPVCLCGERIDREALAQFQYYGITRCDVLIEETEIIKG